MAVVPMPDEPPWTRNVSPAASLPRSNTLYQTVKTASGIADKRDDLIAKLPAPDPAPDLHDFAGDFQAWNFGGAFGRGIAALALHDVGPVYARGNDFHEDFALARRGYRRARCNQDFRPARLANGYARHRFRQMVFRHEYPLFQIPLEVRAGRITPPAAGVTTGKGAAKNPLCRSAPHARRGRRRSAKKEDISRDWPGSHAAFGC